jgi:O-antigen/teichoic acid export membrane protein
MKILINKISLILNKPLFINSFWGGGSQIIQGILLSLYFILIARNYSTIVFANFLVATVLYQLFTAFSSLGLSQWFIRELANHDNNRKSLANQYFKLQIYCGLIFYLLNILFGYFLYTDNQIKLLTIFIGINIVFDNLITAIKCINISELKQKRTFIILTTEASLKFIISCLLLIFPLSIITLSILLIIVRTITLNLFLKIGSSDLINIKSLFHYKISLEYTSTILKINWPFIIIGSVSVINWRISTIIVSKILMSKDVADFEISYRIFSIAQMLPIVVSTSVFPILVKLYKEGATSQFNALYRKIHNLIFLFGILTFTFIYSFIDILLPIIFGPKYIDTGIYTKQMFLAILVFPTAFLQANILVAIKLEKLDMWINIIVLVINLSISLIGLYFIKSLSVINYSIFIAFILFHILQDAILVKKKINSMKIIVTFYLITLCITLCYIILSAFINSFIVFLTFWLLGIFILLSIKTNRKWINNINEITIKKL